MEPIANTFKMDFTIADKFGGIPAIKDTYKRAFNEWHDDYEMLTALVVALNHKIAEHYEADNMEFAKLYDQLWRTADRYAYTHLTDDTLAYFLEVTD